MSRKAGAIQFSAIEAQLKDLLAEFGCTGAAKSRHYPFWHLATDGQGALWDLNGPRELLARPAAATPNLGELKQHHVQGGFPPAVDEALRTVPGLLGAVAARVLETSFPGTLHADIAAAVGLNLDVRSAYPMAADVAQAGWAVAERRRRDPGFRERVLRVYEYRCCVCGFDLRIGVVAAGLEAAHIQWHHTGGPDIEPNGLALCALHHKLFDLGAFTVEPTEHRVVFSQHAIAGNRGQQGDAPPRPAPAGAATARDARDTNLPGLEHEERVQGAGTRGGVSGPAWPASSRPWLRCAHRAKHLHRGASRRAQGDGALACIASRRVCDPA